MTSEQVATELATVHGGAGYPRPLRTQAAHILAEPASAGSTDQTVSRYGITTEALRARGGETPRTLRFRGGFSLQVPQGKSDEQIARLYTAIEAVLAEEDAR